MPTLVVRPALRKSRTHLVAGPVEGPILGGEEAFDMFADDLLAVPAEDPFRRGVPIRHHPVQVGDDHGDIDGAFNDMLEMVACVHSPV
ncbi:hypothetical protein EKPJFOCH_3244 [Methylobacterium thuringiense]|uniref:Uncharacterized protein n=1 Tax=Methylobacterium thuringiense TaxID=1003091 RepID=A0ABQ4TQ40_9HYPH|nr:hypothetical protein [Methylobacterium thuringiense]GJE56736.1 hypothetical protein EKPJFOCH_3244 [Methylobacterium thuringiense]